MELRKYPDPALRQRTRRVETFDQALSDLAAEMIRTMHVCEGLGLAAPQVGLDVRIAIVAADSGPGHETVLMNPELVESSGWEESDEGCLSFPGIYIKVGRYTKVRVRYQDVRGQQHVMAAEAVLARAVQHELDHLDGRLLLDRMSPVQRMTHRRRLKELAERYESRTSGARSAVGP
jgi:peptide deformylase